jgi:7,8-dihydropterin-6-yl-methyl-4-(beta-D-ribofuranosyl)aminobenzene 5'-phosphate synthase
MSNAMEDDMNRRDLLKTLAASSTGMALAGIEGSRPTSAFAATAEDFGEVRAVKVHCISETSWFDTHTFGRDVKNAGGANRNQFDIPFTPENAGGYSALIEVEALSGKKTTYLFDTGWNREWMDYVFAKDGIDKMLKNKEISSLIVSHDHCDHFWGIESTLKHCPDIKTYFPSTASDRSVQLLKGQDIGHPSVKNAIAHRGEIVLTKPNTTYKIQEGMALVLFDIPISLQVRGEQLLYFKIKDKGYVTVTGCCHQGILTGINYARRNFKDGGRHYGCYGGLHVSVYENWDPKFDDLIEGLKGYGLSKIGCNHCTGWIFAEKALAVGLPIIKGTDKNKSYIKVGTLANSKTSNAYIGNGDDLIF